MPAILDLPPQFALEFELTAIAAFEGMIRQLHADQYRRIQRARELAAPGVARVHEPRPVPPDSNGSIDDNARWLSGPHAEAAPF